MLLEDVSIVYTFMINLFIRKGVGLVFSPVLTMCICAMNMQYSMIAPDCQQPVKSLVHNECSCSYSAC